MALNEMQKKERSEYLEKNLKITECSGEQPYVFISYASDNWEMVFKKAIVPLQQESGLCVYADKAFDKVNDKWIVPMLRNIRGADMVISFVSQSYIESYACFLELLTAVNSRTPIVFVALDEELHLGKTNIQPEIERGVKNEILNQGASLSTNTNNMSNDIMRAMKSAYTSLSTLLEQDALSKYDISDAFINFFRDASINRKTLNDLKALRRTIRSISRNVFDESMIAEPVRSASIPPETVPETETVEEENIPVPEKPPVPAYRFSDQEQKKNVLPYVITGAVCLAVGIGIAVGVSGKPQAEPDSLDAENSVTDTELPTEVQETETISESISETESILESISEIESVPENISETEPVVIPAETELSTETLVTTEMPETTAENVSTETELYNKLHNAGTFSGELDENGKANGIGTFTYDDDGRQLMSAKWISGNLDATEDGKFYGTIKYMSVSGEELVEYKGNITSSGRPWYSGKYVYPDGTEVEVEYASGEKWTYFGEMQDGQANGHGITRWSDGSIYDGEFVNYNRNGTGIYIYPDGAYYFGDWENNRANGYGTRYYSDGEFYEGEWKEGKRNGQGIQTKYNENGDIACIYEVPWVDNKKNGDGKQTVYIDGDWISEIYECHWEDDKKNGQGKETMYNKDGSIKSSYEAIWKDDKVVEYILNEGE